METKKVQLDEAFTEAERDPLVLGAHYNPSYGEFGFMFDAEALTELYSKLGMTREKAASVAGRVADRTHFLPVIEENEGEFVELPTDFTALAEESRGNYENLFSDQGGMESVLAA